MAPIVTSVDRAASLLGVELLRIEVKERDDIPGAIVSAVSGALGRSWSSKNR